MTPGETRAAIARAARVSNRPWRGRPLPLLRAGQEHRKLRQLSTVEDRDAAIERARAQLWWCAVVDESPRHPGDFWCWTIETRRLPP